MRRPTSALTLAAGAVVSGISMIASCHGKLQGGGNNNHNKKLHPHFAGLGDGNVDAQQSLRGGGGGGGVGKTRRRRNNNEQLKLPQGKDDDGGQATVDDQFPHERRKSLVGDALLDALDDVDVVDYLQRRAAHREGEDGISQQVGGKGRSRLILSRDSAWQWSFLTLLGMMAVIMGLFFHVTSDSTTTHPSYFRRRARTKPQSFLSPSIKKKTDDWSEDEEATDDDSYRGDAEGATTTMEVMTIAKKRSPAPTSPNDPTATLYYQVNTSNNFRQQEHRQRKLTSQSTQQNNSNIRGGGSGRMRQESTIQAYHSPSHSNKTALSMTDYRNVDKGLSPMPSLPFHSESSDIGSGLEGYVVDHLDTDLTSSRHTDSPAFNKAHPLVKPMGTFLPSESFSSIHSAMNSPLNDTRNDELYCNNHPPLSVNEGAKAAILPTTPGLRQSGDYTRRYIQDMSELPTPRIDHTRGKLELSRMLTNSNREVAGVPLFPPPPPELSDHESLHEAESLDDPDVSYPLPPPPPPPPPPLVPDLSDGSGVIQEGYNNTHFDAPRSVLLEELQLVRMESGVSGPRWRTKYDMQQDDAARQESENMEKLREASTTMDNDPRNSIQHIRKDLTISSDASSSLSSRIAFSELKLEDVIGGGGFGQVWRARWKGTPVAVKVLTGSAQAETVSKAVLEEFIAEINMVSGMRHPNICLFMGACLDPPNRAIVTELCEHGSLWDALRSPLSLYQVADGNTRLAWPLDLYDSINDRSREPFEEPPCAPAGAWPWALVKRVASGTARGMCYLHSGDPPVLHRDLKSANILLDESYTAKLADFGLSRLKAVRSGMTGNCGTVQWMAPEVLCNEDYAEPADVFRLVLLLVSYHNSEPRHSHLCSSFGIIMWEMLTKECPYVSRHG